jgi:glycosyltransferase involved in cell wall biosynthesis
MTSHDDRAARPRVEPSVSVVLPAWNEAEGLRAAVAEAIDALDSLVAGGQVGWYELLVVDDGSTDRTRELAEELASEHPEVRTVSHDRNRGVGASLRSALAIAQGAFLVYTDADMPVDLTATGSAIAAIAEDGADVVAGSRTDRRGEGAIRWCATTSYDLVIRLAFGVRVDDVNFAFKVARTDLLRSLDLRSEGPFIDAELLVLASYGRCDVRVVTMDYRSRRFGQSSTLSVRTLRRLLRELVGALPRLRRARRQNRA